MFRKFVEKTLTEKDIKKMVSAEVRELGLADLLRLWMRCSKCGREVRVVIDVLDDLFRVYCPHCHKKMLKERIMHGFSR